MTDQPDPGPVRRPVYAVKAPLAIDRLTELRPALEVLYGFDLTVESSAGVFIFYTPGRPCSCVYCGRIFDDVTREHRDGFITMKFMMDACTLCASRSCPHARYHGSPCQRDDTLQRLAAQAAQDLKAHLYPPTKETP
jgi:hypothetical protein